MLSTRLVLISTLFLWPASHLCAQTLSPFSITLEEITYAEWPGLQSFVSGEWEGRQLVMCGRTGGLHAFLPPNPFMPTEANKSVWMLDPATGDMWESGTESLADETKQILQSTNPQAFQKGRYLYIIGGYGNDEVAMEMRTFPAMTAVDLELLSGALEAGTDITGAFRTISDTLFEVTGGEIGVIGDTVYLFGGHSFTGVYSKPAGPQFTQIYTNRLTKFTLTDDGTEITLDDIEQIIDTIAFHRRDLNFEPIILPEETPALIALSGVFQYEADWVWFEPVIVSDTGYYIDEAFMQKMNNYTCPVISLYDSATAKSYHTLFGGISQYWYDEEDAELIEDLNVPFVNDITTIVRNTDGTMEQIIEPITMDGLLGSNAEYWQLQGIPQYANHVLKLHDVHGLTHVGYIFGGIQADIPNFTPSVASNRLFKVYITVEDDVAVHTDKPGTIQLYPNPVQTFCSVDNTTGSSLHAYQITDITGRVVTGGSMNLSSGYRTTIPTSTLTSGMYIITFSSLDKEFALPFIKE